MGVHFYGSKDNPKWVYTPENTSDAQVNFIKDVAKLNKLSDGYVSKKKELRLEAKIPLSVEYNYCMMKGIMPDKHGAYMKKHLKDFLAEFPVFKVVNSL